MRIVRESELAFSTGTNIFIRPILKGTVHIKIPFVDTYYILTGDSEREYTGAKERMNEVRMNLFWEQARVIFAGRKPYSYQTS